jgi:putative transcriptional regulator
MSADADPDSLAPVTLRARVFAGYSGWGAGQLESELEEESWLVLDPEASDIFAPDAADLWSTVLHRQGGALALLARMPPDPSMN